MTDTETRRCPAEDCPGHRLCPGCGSDVCPEASCGGCRCPERLCAWASYKADCPEVYEAAETAGLPACAGCGNTAVRCRCTGGFMATNPN